MWAAADFIKYIKWLHWGTVGFKLGLDVGGGEISYADLVYMWDRLQTLYQLTTAMC